MYVCLCHAVTEKQISEAVAQGAKCMKDLRATLGITVTCGKCASCARDCLKQNQSSCEQNISYQLAEAS